MSRKLIVLILLGLWLPSVQSRILEDKERDKLSSRHQLVNSTALNVGHVLSAHENKQKPPLGPISEAIVPHFGAGRVWSQRHREKSEHAKRSLKIYELNRVLLI